MGLDRTVRRGAASMHAALLGAQVLCGCGDAAGGGRDGDTTDSGVGPGSIASDSADSSAGASDPTSHPSDFGGPPPPTCASPPNEVALEVLGIEEGVHVGPAANLGLEAFTVEAWVRRDGYGTAASSGVGGIVGEPILAKGRGESDGSNVDCNYIMAIDAQGRLVADFEDMRSGANHPVTGVRTIAIGQWHHVAAAYDGTTWRLFVDGALDATLVVDAAPRADSIGHVGIGTALDSMGIAQGSFDGRIDEVRVWGRALGEAELQSGMHGAPPDTTDLVAHWPMDAEAGETVSETVGGQHGTRVGTRWTDDGRPVRQSVRPAAPTAVAPVLTSAAAATELVAGTFDADGDPLRVDFYGRALPVVEPFSVVVLPDTQYYCEESRGATAEMFYAQTQWIVENAERYDIKAVLHVGDLVDNGHQAVDEWLIAQTAMETLEQSRPGYPSGVPYGIAIGNHDQASNSLPGETQFYNMYFGVERFTGREYYGGHLGDRNDFSYITFGSGELQMLALFIEYDQPGVPEGNTGPDPHALAWARRVVADHPDHLAVAVGHSCLSGTGAAGNPTVGTPFSSQGRTRYEALRGEPNLRMLVCGHVEDEGRRTDVAASTVHTLLSDYQFDDNGGSGKLRLMTFDPTAGQLEVQTYSPHFDRWYDDSDAHFTLPIDLLGGGGEFELVGTVEHVVPGDEARVPWPGLVAGERYEWYARVDDCTHGTEGPRTSFVAQ